MPSKRILLALLCLIMVAASVSALSISAEDAIPNGTQWSFSVNYTLSASNDLKVLIDDVVVLHAFEHAGSIYVNDAQKSPKVVSYSNSSGTLFVSFSGMSEGVHKISAKILSADAVVDETSFDVEFFQPLTSSEKDALAAKINSLEAVVATQRNTIDSQQATVNALSADNAQKQQEIDYLQETNERMEQIINELNSNVTTLEENDASKGEILAAVKYDLNVLMSEREEARNSPLVGMLAFGSQNFIWIGLIALVALVVIVGVVMYKNKAGSVYSTPILGGHSFDTGIKDDSIGALQKDEGPLGSGKWAFAFGGFRKKAPEEKEVSSTTSKPAWGSLIKK